MKQLLQYLATGVTEVVNAPSPKVRPGHVLIDVTLSLVSAGTERMLVDFGRASLLAKARQQPDKVKQVIEKARTDGLLTTFDAVQSKLNNPIPLGYSSVGVVRESGAEGLKDGDRVVSNGPHADVVCVPRNLCARIPDNVSDEQAAFTVVASIGLQGIRLVNPTLGECIVVTGVGLIGQLTVRLLKAQGCRVLAIDFDAEKLALAKQYGADICNLSAGEDPVAAATAFSRGRGVDGVIITASTTSNEPISQAARMCRKRGRIVLVGVAGLELNRAEFYDKELTFQVSCSYGPGRYDQDYEQRGVDYPIGFVRWTEQRNFEAVLDLMAANQLSTEGLVSLRQPFAQATEAYDRLSSDKRALGIMLLYESSRESRAVDTIALHADAQTKPPQSGAPVVGVIGAGNYASRILIPAFKAGNAMMHTVASEGGTSSVVHGRGGGFKFATSNVSTVFGNADINTVVVATRHNSHARLTMDALSAGKHVFVEKPLALTIDELQQIEEVYQRSNRLLMVGFNRRFAPLVASMKNAMSSVAEPKSLIMVMNAGAIPHDHWSQDRTVGGGRIIGEACHFVDLMRFLVGAPIISVQARRMGRNAAVPVVDDKAAITLGFADGSFGTIHYLANGGRSFPKERIEVFAAGRTMQLDNFLKLRSFNWPGVLAQRLWRQDKGQTACVQAFLEHIRSGGPAPIPAEELFEVARATIKAADLLAEQTA